MPRNGRPLARASGGHDAGRERSRSRGQREEYDEVVDDIDPRGQREEYDEIDDIDPRRFESDWSQQPPKPCFLREWFYSNGYYYYRRACRDVSHEDVCCEDGDQGFWIDFSDLSLDDYLELSSVEAKLFLEDLQRRESPPFLRIDFGNLSVDDYMALAECEAEAFLDYVRPPDECCNEHYDECCDEHYFEGEHYDKCCDEHYSEAPVDLQAVADLIAKTHTRTFKRYTGPEPLLLDFWAEPEARWEQFVNGLSLASFDPEAASEADFLAFMDGLTRCSAMRRSLDNRGVSPATAAA